jgi:hypothetical protein
MNGVEKSSADRKKNSSAEGKRTHPQMKMMKRMKTGRV